MQNGRNKKITNGKKIALHEFNRVVLYFYYNGFITIVLLFSRSLFFSIPRSEKEHANINPIGKSKPNSLTISLKLHGVVCHHVSSYSLYFSITV